MEGRGIRRIIELRLPQRARGRSAALAIEVGVGVLVPLLFVAARYALIPFSGDRAPYALNFLAVVIATVLAGWRGGLLATIFGQALSWVLIASSHAALMDDSGVKVGLVVATVSQVLLVLVLALYQRVVDRGVAEREHRIALEQEARHEIDHRVRNYLQTILALIHLQAQRSGSPDVKDTLEQIGARISAVSLATEQLSRAGDPLSTVRLGEHLSRLCQELEKGLAWDGMKLECAVEDVAVDSQQAVYLGMIVNELVTNALKHAFRGHEQGTVRVTLERRDAGLHLVVEDDGHGIDQAAPTRGSALGTRLVKTFVRELGAKYRQSSSAEGTVHSIELPA